MIISTYTKQLISKKRYYGKKVNHKVLNELGFYILKNVFNDKIINNYKSEFLSKTNNKKLKKTKTHLVEYKIHESPFFKKIYSEKDLKSIVKSFYNGNVGSDFFRIVSKDKNNTMGVFCHQDVGYQMGSFERYSLFISLTDNNYNNGGLIVYPCTHKFGYLGDTGEISKKITTKLNKIKTDLKSGDVLIMHSALWHESHKNKNKLDRIYFEIHIQDANEPTTRYMIIGKNKKNIMIKFDRNKIFSNSRKQRIAKYKKQLLSLKKQIQN